ncbi:MAG: DUF885 domain-containing protein [Propioniciclava sp.]
MTTREPTPIDHIAEEHARAILALSPLTATAVGEPGYDHLLDDLSPAGHAAVDEQNRRTLAALAQTEVVDAVDQVTVAALRDRLGLAVEGYQAGDHLRDLNTIASPLQEVRDVFDLMPTASADDWATVARRLAALPDALSGYAATLREGIGTGIVPAERQVRAARITAAHHADPASSFFTALIAAARPDGDVPGAALAADLAAGAARARAAFRTLATFLGEELAPAAVADDAVGPERYARASRSFVGATLDLDETYAWGIDQLASIAEEQRRLSREILGHEGDLAETVAHLNADPATQLHGTAALREWMQATADEAIAALHGVHFDIPEPVRTVEAMIAPTQTGGIYYTPPSDDFSRPGRMWWSVPAGTTTFATWSERTTVYHEGVPGHHLQFGQAAVNPDLNRWRRQFCWLSGHGEGWALYAERLMDEFGFLPHPGERFGMLDAQRMRAVRVVIDIGLHLGRPAFAAYGGGRWDYDKATALFADQVTMGAAERTFEMNRYAGWPGQAPSYLVGQRLWQQTREAAEKAARARGEVFSLKDFHTRALNLGSVPLDVLADQMTR